MRLKMCLLAVFGVVISASTFAKNETRLHRKCYLQIEDNSHIVHQFVTSESNTKKFSASLNGRTIFMADGKTEQKIVTSYECIDVDSKFKNERANEIEKITAF